LKVFVDGPIGPKRLSNLEVHASHSMLSHRLIFICLYPVHSAIAFQRQKTRLAEDRQFLIDYL